MWSLYIPTDDVKNDLVAKEEMSNKLKMMLRKTSKELNDNKATVMSNSVCVCVCVYMYSVASTNKATVMSNSVCVCVCTCVV